MQPGRQCKSPPLRGWGGSRHGTRPVSRDTEMLVVLSTPPLVQIELQPQPRPRALPRSREARGRIVVGPLITSGHNPSANARLSRDLLDTSSGTAETEGHSFGLGRAASAASEPDQADGTSSDSGSLMTRQLSRESEHGLRASSRETLVPAVAHVKPVLPDSRPSTDFRHTDSRQGAQPSYHPLVSRATAHAPPGQNTRNGAASTNHQTDAADVLASFSNTSDSLGNIRTFPGISDERAEESLGNWRETVARLATKLRRPSRSPPRSRSPGATHALSDNYSSYSYSHDKLREEASGKLRSHSEASYDTHPQRELQSKELVDYLQSLSMATTSSTFGGVRKEGPSPCQRDSRTSEFNESARDSLSCIGLCASVCHRLTCMRFRNLGTNAPTTISVLALPGRRPSRKRLTPAACEKPVGVLRPSALVLRRAVALVAGRAKPLAWRRYMI